MAILLCLFFLLASASACDRCVHQTKAAYFPQDSALSSGACGYGPLALEFTRGHLAAATPAQYRNGARCGACYQIRCKNTELCTTRGTTVTLTDVNKGNETEFVISSQAFMALAKEGLGQHILKQGIVDVEYKRVPCEYERNLAVLVEEPSQPHNLAIKILYQAGQTEIVSIDVARVGSNRWSYMRRTNGAVWETSRVPEGELQLRLVVTSGFDGKRVWARRALPANWKPGVVYDTGVKLNEIAKEGCSPCDDGNWD